MTRKLLFAAPLLATAVLAAGCGGGGYGDNASTASTPAAARSAATVAKTQSDATEVKMAGTAFAPADVSVKVGETVTFVNDDPIAHTATAGDGAFDSGTMEPGAKFSFTAKKAGQISYVCAFHPGMTGKITVT